jgi:hypothetical protein
MAVDEGSCPGKHAGWESLESDNALVLPWRKQVLFFSAISASAQMGSGQGGNMGSGQGGGMMGGGWGWGMNSGWLILIVIVVLVILGVVVMTKRK